MIWGWSPSLFIGSWYLRGWQTHSQSHPTGIIAASLAGRWHLGRSSAWSGAERVGMERLTPRGPPGHLSQVTLPYLPSKEHSGCVSQKEVPPGPQPTTAGRGLPGTGWSPATTLGVAKLCQPQSQSTDNYLWCPRVIRMPLGQGSL